MMRDPSERLQMQQKDTTDLMDLQSTLRVLADKTGGRAVMNTNVPEAKVPEIFRESESYYLLAFERDPNMAADATRPIEIKVNRKGAHVYAQRRYASPPPTATGRPPVDVRASLMAAVEGLLPSASAPLAMTASPFALPAGDNAWLNIVIDTGAFAQAAASVPLEVRVAAFSPEGRQGVAAQQTSTIPPAAGIRGRPPVVNVPTHLELPPGEYEIRAAVADPSSGRVASVFQPVSVPAFAKAPISLSGIAIERSAGGFGTAAGGGRRSVADHRAHIPPRGTRSRGLRGLSGHATVRCDRASIGPVDDCRCARQDGPRRVGRADGAVIPGASRPTAARASP